MTPFFGCTELLPGFPVVLKLGVRGPNLGPFFWKIIEKIIFKIDLEN